MNLDELIREVTISQAERGLLLLRVRDELRMTLTAYQDLFVSAREHDPRKSVAKEAMAVKHEVMSKHNELASVINRLDEEKKELIRMFENNEQIFKEERESANSRHHEDFQFLKRVNNTLKVCSKAFSQHKHLLLQNIFFILATNRCNARSRE